MVNVARFMGLVAAVTAVTAGHAAANTGNTPGIRIATMPAHVVQGTSAKVSITVRPGTRCTLSVQYTGGASQGAINRALDRGGFSWTWTVPTTVQAGLAHANFHCGRVSLSRRFVVVGRLDPPKITVAKTGYSTRPVSSGGTRLSYGVMVHNDSTTQDASNIVVQTNFVLPDDHLLGTDTQHVNGIPAGPDFAVGNTVTFPGAAPIVRLEVVVQTQSFVPHAIHLPTLANIHLLPQLTQPAWLGSIEGEIQNTDPALTLRSATLTAVLFSADGSIVGGTSGFAFQTLPAGARAFIKLSNGLDVIPVTNAATAFVSMQPSWVPPGT